MENQSEKKNSRRKFIQKALLAGGTVGIGWAAFSSTTVKSKDDTEETVKLLTPDGKLVEVKKSVLQLARKENPAKGIEARKGIPGRKFVMVIDLAKCKNARKCTESCQKGHQLPPDQEWIKVYLLKDNKAREPYWFPKPCYHCDDPPCVKVCPVSATYKRTDGCVLVDADRCIGCKFCISACPYSVRVFNWKNKESYKDNDPSYSPETSVPGQVGTVGKCDFCPDRSRDGELPYCAASCPTGAIYFGDSNEDTITNGEETVRFKETVENKAGYRFLEEMGTNPNVFYLPPVNKIEPYEKGFESLDEEETKMYKRILKKNIEDGK